MKVYIVNGSSQYRDMWEDSGGLIVNSVEDSDIVQFTGGSDVWPTLYGEECHPTTHYDKNRDYDEGVIFRAAIERGCCFRDPSKA